MPTSIQNPAGYTVTRAIAFADIDGSMLQVAANSPLPVTMSAATTTPLAGSTGGALLAGPFQPVIGRPVILVLSGSWTGLVSVTRSTDGGTTRVPLTANGATWAQFSGNCCEAVWEESDASARLYLDIAVTSGTLTYRIAQ